MQAIKELIKESEGLEMRLKSSGGENSNFKELWKKRWKSKWTRDFYYFFNFLFQKIN